MNKIFYPTDGSASAKEALKVVVDLARPERFEVIVVDAVDSGAVEDIKDAAMDEMLNEAFRGFVSEAVVYLKTEGVHARGVVDMGRPDVVIGNSMSASTQ